MSDENNVVDLNTQILKDIRKELRELTGLKGLPLEMNALRAEVSELRDEVGELREEVGELRVELHDGLKTVNTRLETLERETIRGFTAVRRELDRLNDRVDNLRDVSGERWRDLDKRVTRLERHRRGRD